MLNLDKVLIEVSNALASDDPSIKDSFIETYVPQLVNEVQTLRNEKNFLELQLTEQEEGDDGVG